MTFNIIYRTKSNKEVSQVIYGTLEDLEEALKKCRKNKQEVISLSGTH